MLEPALQRGSRTARRTCSSKFAFICQHPLSWQERNISTSPAQRAKIQDRPDSASKVRPLGRQWLRQSPKPPTKGSQYDKYREDYARIWADRLDPLLPPQHRINSTSATDRINFEPDVLQIADLLLEAHRITPSLPFDLLSVFAIDQGRWRLVVWLVKVLLEGLRVEDIHSERLAPVIQKWKRTGTLDQLTNEPLYFKPDVDGTEMEPHLERSKDPSLDFTTSTFKFEGLSRREQLGHDTLGLIWRALGSLTITCATDLSIAGGRMKPEILEMLALVHHHGFMPASTYASTPSDTPDAIQQPPTLHLLSSKIMNALSDAAWTATQAEASDSNIGAKRSPWKPSLFTKIPVAGLMPEIWLELVLWACLHGGWVLQGTAVLRRVCQLEGKSKWRPTSWRDAMQDDAPFGQSKYIDWESLKYAYETSSTAEGDATNPPRFRTERTVSSEVVNAYLDALVSSISVGVGSRGSSRKLVLNSLHDFREFLQRANLNLVGGTWDAMMVRLVESNGLGLERNPWIIPRLVAESPGIGQELSSRNSQPLPSYVLDGSAAIIGLLHRALRSYIQQGRLGPAVSVMQLLQNRVDDERRRSLADFFQSKTLAQEASHDLFTDNFTGIDYPSFEMQIPANLLASFLELVTENKEYEFGTWLLTSDDLDGPTIPEHLYGDPAVSAAIVRFAASSNNMDLLSKIVQIQSQRRQGGDAQYEMPREVLAGFLDAQIQLRNWDTVERMLVYVRDTANYDWTVESMAEVVRAMLVESIAPDAGDFDSNSARARNIFLDLCRGEYNEVRCNFSKTKRRDVDSLLLAVASLSQEWAAICQRARTLPRSLQFDMSSATFARVLEGVVAAHGAEAGMKLVQNFWRPTLEHDPASPPLYFDQDATEEHGTHRMPRYYRPRAQGSVVARDTIRIPGPADRKVSFYQMNRIWTPTVSMLLNILRKALQEYEPAKSHAVPASDFNRTATTSVSEAIAGCAAEKRGTKRSSIFIWAVLSACRLRLSVNGMMRELKDRLTLEDFAVVEAGVDEGFPLHRKPIDADQTMADLGLEKMAHVPFTDAAEGP